MPDTLFSEIAKHLEYFGYSVATHENILLVQHDTKFSFMVLPFRNGAMFQTGFTMNSKSMASERGIQFLARSNSSCIISRYEYVEQGMQVTAWYPNSYNRSAFVEFFDQYLADINAPFAFKEEYSDLFDND